MDAAHRWMLVLNIAILICVVTGAAMLFLLLKGRESKQENSGAIRRVFYITGFGILILSFVVMAIGILAKTGFLS